MKKAWPEQWSSAHAFNPSTTKPRMAQEKNCYLGKRSSWQAKHHSQLLASDVATPANLVAGWLGGNTNLELLSGHSQASRHLPEISGTASYQNWSNEQSPSGMQFLSLTISISYLFSF